MKTLGSVTEAEMIAIFLEAEIDSTRYNKSITQAVAKLGATEDIIRNPDLTSDADNETRKRLLTLHRHYEERTELFEGFPDNVQWVRVELSKEELLDVRYMEYSFWNELTGGTRKIQDALQRIRDNKMPYDGSNEKYLSAAEALRGGKVFPEIVLVGEKEDGPYVALEGHLRLSTYGLMPDHIPQPFTAIVGVSPHMMQWSGW